MEIKELLADIEKRKTIYSEGKEKLRKILSNENVDTLPLIFWKSHNSGDSAAVASTPGNSYNMREQFYDKKKMLYAHLEEIRDIAKNTYDAQLCIRPNFGTIFIPAIFGLEYEVPEDAYPWLTEHFSKSEIKKINVADLDNSQMMKTAINYLEYFQDMLPEWIHVYLPDTQGPFDIAHLLYGENLFYDLIEDPKFVHYLMKLSTEVFIKVTEKLKNVISEKRTECYHGHALPRGIFMDNGGTRISEDTATLISPKHIDEFVIPYDQKCLEAFGGGFIHFCGEHRYLLESYLKLEKVRAVNFGNPEMYDFYETMKKFINYDKCYFGLWPKMDEESLEDYIYRMKKATSTEEGQKGLLLHFDESMFTDYSQFEILKIWNEILKK